MDLRFRSQASLCSSQTSHSVRSQPCLRWVPFSANRASVGKYTTQLLSIQRGQLAGERLQSVCNDGLKGILLKKRNRLTISASIPGALQIASRLFTFGTAFVVPFYTVMILAPHATWTKKFVESSIPYVVLGVLYVYLLALSWSPETLHLMFASKYWLPELPGITRMFSSTLTVASAWLHLLVVDLFAGRQIYLDGLRCSTETRHSLVLCLLFCPVGILSHFFTKAVVHLWRKANSDVPNVAELYS
ncbi:hypothetical protein KP509_26G019600 [Ceratopteris richardii]|uniref:Protein ABA DEFICIENT 4, chloroplastic-like n=1 Tax=Ceratopteris richardii TaxID=49495 RepID=A0A8T2RLA5_CERRI|nr:hypothetical protein KP509_26G019600 [Ceratopteris richardii]